MSQLACGHETNKHANKHSCFRLQTSKAVLVSCMGLFCTAHVWILMKKSLGKVKINWSCATNGLSSVHQGLLHQDLGPGKCTANSLKWPKILMVVQLIYGDHQGMLKSVITNALGSAYVEAPLDHLRNGIVEFGAEK